MSELINLARRASLTAAAMLLTAPVFGDMAFAQPMSGPDAPLSVVPIAQRLTLAGVFSHAKPVVQLLLAGLVVAIAYAAFVYIRGLIGRRDRNSGGAVFLFALAAAGPLIGLFGASYDMLDSFIGMANVRPAPTITILAPGLAEAALCLTLGLLAGAVGVIGHRHLTGQTQAAVQAASPVAEPPAAHPARAIG